jgi:hypothetical protein
MPERCRHDGAIARDAHGTEVCLGCGEYVVPPPGMPDSRFQTNPPNNVSDPL